MRHVLQTFLLSGIVLTLKTTAHVSSPSDSGSTGHRNLELGIHEKAVLCHFPRPGFPISSRNERIISGSKVCLINLVPVGSMSQSYSHPSLPPHRLSSFTFNMITSYRDNLGRTFVFPLLSARSSKGQSNQTSN
ncbi:hypothetical protein AVEN_228985-1 [Araneus ventricosus]|uniref:Secreted protein n=1 Tax=Araneus ventricosus TaxID=182803 RepID=A0A4Y2I7W0_ARAVE|nr:hypothetical protein AVEN_228985-1 [Araneus ventricosus]